MVYNAVLCPKLKYYTQQHIKKYNMKTKNVSQLIKYGFTLMPCNAKTKRPVLPEWQKSNGTDGRMVEEWCGKYKNICMGIVCGAPSNIIILDIDSSEARDKLFKLGEIPMTPCVKTKDGWHYYFALPEGNASRTRQDIIKNVDMRGVGGYAIAPGTVLEDGAQYEWLISPDDCGYTTVPDWLVELLAKKKKRVKSKKRNRRDFMSNNGHSLTFEQRFNRVLRILSKIKRSVVKKDMTINMDKIDETFNKLFKQRGCPVPYVYTEHKAEFLRKAGQSFVIHYGVLLSKSVRQMEKLGRTIMHELNKHGIKANCNNFTHGRIVVLPSSTG
jgi:hypothetical protein